MANRLPSQYNLIELSIINFNGVSVDIKSSLSKLNIYADLFNTCLHGTIEIKDKGDFQQNIPLIGEEILYIKFQLDANSPKEEHFFYLYQMVDKEKEGEDTFKYTFNFASIELLNNRKTLVSESFYNMNVTDIIDKVFSKISKKTVDKEQTTNKIQYIAPSISPFEIINYLGARAISSTYPNSGGMLFFEDLNGFKFKTIDSMMNGNVKATYSFNHKSQTNTNIDVEYYSISKWRVPQHYNILDNLNKGMYGSVTMVLDPFTRKYVKKTYNYFNNDDYNKTSHIEKNPNNKLHTSKFLFQDAPNSFLKYRLSNEDEKANGLGVRYSQLNQISNFYQLVVEVPGNNDLYVGDLLDINYLNYSSDSDKKVLDLYLRGKYMITASRHIFTQTEYHTVLELVKDSYYSNHEEFNRVGMI